LDGKPREVVVIGESFLSENLAATYDVDAFGQG
jgi:hypothetical protein